MLHHSPEVFDDPNYDAVTNAYLCILNGDANGLAALLDGFKSSDAGIRRDCATATLDLLSVMTWEALSRTVETATDALANETNTDVSAVLIELVRDARNLRRAR